MTSSATTEGWFKTVSTLQMEIIRIYGAGDVGMEAGLIGGKFYFSAFQGTWIGYTWNTGPVLNDGAWHHFAVVSSGNDLDAYVEGVFVTTVNGSGPLNTGVTSLFLGLHPSAGLYFDGSLDEVRVWNTARTQNQIQDNMNCSLSGVIAGLVANHNFNQGIPGGNNTFITTLNDISGNGNNGTLTNFALTGATSNWVTDANLVPPVAAVSITSSTTTACSGTNITFTASPNNGGTSPGYQWLLNGGNVGSNSNIYSNSGLLSSDVISCLLTPSIPCAATPTSNTISVTMITTPTVNVTGNMNICSGASTTLTASGAINYTWNPGGTTGNTISGAPPSTFTFSVIGADASGSCTTTATGTINVSPNPTVNISGTTLICEGSSTILTASGADTFTWTSGPSTASNTVSPTSNTTYTVTGTTTATGCTNTSTQLVTVNALPVILAQSGNVTACGDVGASFTVNSPGNNTYEWYYINTVSPFDGDTIDGSYAEINFTTDSMTIMQLLTGGYNDYAVYCVITNSNNCSITSASDTIKAYIIPTLTVTATATLVCAGSNVTLTASGANTYTWTSGPTTASNTVSPTSNTTYTVTGTNTTTGCSNTATQLVNVLATSASSQTVTLCPGQNITVGANTYTATNIYVDVLVAANGCDSTVTTDLTVNAAVDVSTSSTGATITANAGSAVYQWIDCNNGNAIIPSETNQSYTAGTSGDYAVIVTVGSCSDTSSCVNINLTGLNGNNFDASTISVFPNPGTGFFTIQTSGNTLSSYVVMDIKGSIVLKGNLTSTKTVINLLDMENGMYILKIDNKFIKLMKQE